MTPVDFNPWGEPERTPVDFPSVKAASLSNAQSILERFQPGGRVVRGEYVCAGIYGGKGDSCSTNLRTGVGMDFASGQKWGDLIDLVAQIDNISMGEAARVLSDDLGMDSREPRYVPVAPIQSPDERYARGQKVALGLLNESSPCPHHHPYLAKKGVWASNDIRLHEATGNILVPLYDKDGTLWSVQRIFPDGSKKINPDGKLTGNFFVFPGARDTVYICEGYATAATVAQATGKTVIMAISAGNLIPVAVAICEAYPKSDIVFAADNDGDKTPNPGIKAAEDAAAKCRRGRVVAPPYPKGSAGDWNDYATEHGIEAAKRLLLIESKRGVQVSRWGTDAYEGRSKPTEWVVENVLPRGKAAILAAPGDSGKGMLTLDLALKVATYQGEYCGVDLNGNGGWWGNKILGGGKVVIFSAEDDRDEIHRRIENMDPDGSLRAAAKGRLFIVPLPNDGGPIPLVVTSAEGVSASTQYYEIIEQLRGIEGLALVNFDPLASFVTADINADPQVGAFTMGLLASLAIEVGAAVMVAHHTNKSKEAILSPEQARLSIRGTTAIVDGVRSSLALWGVPENKARVVCDAIGVEFKRNRVFEGAVVKANGPADREVKTFVRNEMGLLEVCDAALSVASISEDDLKITLKYDIRNAAELKRPFRATGTGGVWDRREECNAAVRSCSKERVEGAVRRMLVENTVLRCGFRGTAAAILDVPDGDYAKGIETSIAPGFSLD